MQTQMRITVTHCECEVCGWKWRTEGAKESVQCPKCRSRQWDGKKERRVKAVEIPGVVRVREWQAP